GAVTLASLMLMGCGGSHSSSGSATTASGASSPTLAPPAKITASLTGPGVTATTITLGQITTISGPVPGLFQGANDGLDAWAAWINANGGLDGRTVKIDHVDDGFSCNTYTSAFKQMATTTFAVVGNFTLEDTCGKSVLAANPNLIDVQAATLDPSLYGTPNLFAPSPNPA